MPYGCGSLTVDLPHLLYTAAITTPDGIRTSHGYIPDSCLYGCTLLRFERRPTPDSPPSTVRLTYLQWFKHYTLHHQTFATRSFCWFCSHFSSTIVYPGLTRLPASLHTVQPHHLTRTTRRAPYCTVYTAPCGLQPWFAAATCPSSCRTLRRVATVPRTPIPAAFGSGGTCLLAAYAP